MHPIQRIIDPAHHIIIADLTIIPGRRLDTKPVQRSQSLIAYHHCHIIFLLKIHQMAIRTEPKLSFIRCPARKSLRLGLHHQIIIMLQAADHIYHSEKPAREASLSQKKPNQPHSAASSAQTIQLQTHSPSTQASSFPVKTLLKKCITGPKPKAVTSVPIPTTPPVR